MPDRDPDPADPHVLVGVSVAGTPEDLRLMVRAIAEEFAQLSYSREEILGLFENPFYRAPHGLLAALGRDAIERIVDEVSSAWARVTCRVEEADPEAPPLVGPGGRLKVLS